jgi:hypothetical protein
MSQAKTVCGYCQKPIDGNIETCPHCTRRVRPRNNGSLDYDGLKAKYGTPENMRGAPKRYGHVLPGGYKAGRSERAESTEVCPSVQPESVPNPLKVKAYDKARVAKLIELRYESLTGRKLAKALDVAGGGTNETLARRAQEQRKIQDFEIHGGKIWFLRVQEMTPGIGDKKRPAERN